MTGYKFASLSLGAAIAAALIAPAAVAQDDELVLPPVVVTADPLGDRTVDDLIRPTTVVTGEALERRRTGTLGEVLDGLPGVANSDFGPGVGRPVIRGLQGSRVQVLEDGLPSIDVSGEGADHAVGIDPLRARTVEILRGPATLLYGSGAAGGVVNVVSHRFDPVIGDRVSGTLYGSYADNGNDWQGHVRLDAPVGTGFALRSDWNIRRSDDFDIKGFQQTDQEAGRLDKLVISDIETDSSSATAMWSGDWGYFGLGVSTWETDYGIPENFDARPRDLGGQEDHFERVFAEYDRFDLRGELFNPLPGFASARVKLAWTDFEQEEVEFEFDRTPDGGELDEFAVEAEFAKKTFESRVELLHEPIGNMRGVIGLSFVDTDFEADDPRGADRGFYVRPTETRSLAMFVLEELPTDFGRLEFGARVERERASPEDVFGYRVDGVSLEDGSFLPFPEVLPSRNFTPLSLSAGALVDLTDHHHLRTALTGSQRSPSAEQLYAFGRHAPAGTFEVGDPDLDKEKYLNFEVGIDRHHGPFRYDFTVFYNRVDDFIYLLSEDDGSGQSVFVNDIGNRAGEGAAAGCEPGDGGLCRLRNELVFSVQDDAEFYGAEFGAVVDLATGRIPFSLRMSGDYVRGRLRGDGNLPRITPPRAGVGFDTGFGDFSFSGDYQRVFKQNKTGVAEDETSGYHLLGFDLVWQPIAVDGLRLFLRGRNLTNEDGRRHQSFFKDEAPILGRSITAGVRYDFGG